MKVRFSPRSRDDLAEILDHIDRRSSVGGRNVRAAILGLLRLIGQVPTIGRQIEPSLRCVWVPRYPYLVYYSVGVRSIDIVHIRHAARERPTSV